MRYKYNYRCDVLQKPWLSLLQQYIPIHFSFLNVVCIYISDPTKVIMLLKDQVT